MSMLPTDHDDPRLTAYALGESSEADREAVEKILAESPEARAEVAGTRALARLLSTGYVEEHARYLASLPEAEASSKIVTFRSGRQDRQQRTAFPMLKAAALLALTASLVYFTLRRPVPRTMEMAVTPPPAASPPAPMPPLVAVAQAPQIAATVGGDAEDADSARYSASDRQQSAESPVVATGSADTLLATKDEQPSARTLERPLRERTSEVAPATARAPAPMQVDGVAALPSFTAAVNKPTGPRATDEPFARSVVRVRSPNGVFYAGVIVSPDGLILTPAPLQDGALNGRWTARMADGRELPAAVERASVVSGWGTLHVNAVALPSATLASDQPAGDAPLTVPIVEPQSGSLNFSRLQTAESVSSSGGTRARSRTTFSEAAAGGLAFNAAGELLITGLAAVESQKIAKTKSTANGATPSMTRARAFTPAERAMLQRIIAHGNSQ